MAISKRLRFEVFRRDNYTCRYCGRSAPEVILRPDHVVPVALGGTDDPTNLVTSCHDCNSGKSSVAPDSALVADVAADALRWAAAQKLVAERLASQLRERRALHDEFDYEWQRWGHSKIPRPANWASSLDSFLDAGLPMEIILDCVRRAMENGKLPHSEIFRYMCGIAWNRVNKMREQVAAEVKADQPAPPEAQPAARESTVGQLVSGLMWTLDQGDIDRAKAGAVREAQEQGREVPQGDNLWIEAAEWAFGDMAYRLDLLWRMLGELFDAVPESMNARAVERARAEVADDADPMDLVPRAFMYLVADLKAAQIIPAAE